MATKTKPNKGTMKKKRSKEINQPEDISRIIEELESETELDLIENPPSDDVEYQGELDLHEDNFENLVNRKRSRLDLDDQGLRII